MKRSRLSGLFVGVTIAVTGGALVLAPNNNDAARLRTANAAWANVSTAATPVLNAIPTRAHRADEFTIAMEYESARAELAKADPSDPAVRLAKARLALYEEDCDLAAALSTGTGTSEEANVIGDVARGCARVTAATVVDRDDENGIVIRYHDEADRVLTPLLVETALKARVSLTRDLGVEWKRPTRITVVRDLLSLSAMTGLPYKAAQTTGTVAVAKWGRVTLLSPRASRHGYAFRDTLTHELTHLAIAMQSNDRAPLWLHEGVARREEVRWREPSILDDRPNPESIVARGIEMKLDLALDKLGPSIAMLPSAEAAMVAFAEVTSFIKYFADSSPPDALAKVLLALRTAPSPDEALHQVSGSTLAEWDRKWRADLATHPRVPLSPLLGLGAQVPGLRESRERARLAELLFGRGHPSEAKIELEKVPAVMLADPNLRYLKARVLEGDGQIHASEQLVDDVSTWVSSYGPCWAIRGRLAEARGDKVTAEASFAEAIAQDPLGVESACRALTAPAEPRNALCEGARKRAEPDIGFVGGL
jgi:hypothetical protein